MPGDPNAPWWTYADLAAVFGRGEDQVRRLVPAWEAQGFPVPLPWSRRQKRWNPAAILAWKQRQEIRHRSTTPAVAA